MGHEQIAYVAGFFDGEGHVSFPKANKWQVRLTFTQKDLHQLEVVQEIIQAGKIYGPYNGCYRLVVNRREDIQRVAELLLPWCVLKRPKLELALRRMKRTWGNRN